MRVLGTLLILSISESVSSFCLAPLPGRVSTGACLRGRQASFPLSAQKGADNDKVDLESLKSELLLYLEKRKELGADDLAKANVGKIVGGTKGNAVLEYISGSPNKEIRVETAPNALDYDELVKYGYSHLVAPIMKAGGRLAMYELLGLEAPDTSKSLRSFSKSAPPLVIDRDGKNDKARYSGLKLGQVMDDNLQAEALARAQKRAARGESMRPILEEEKFEQPFADKRNVSPGMTPNWTPEKLDEWGKQQGKVQAWARREREGTLVTDTLESLDLDLQQRVFSILTALLLATAFGKSTPTFLDEILALQDRMASQGIVGALEGPALGLLLASVGSCIFCATSAPSKNRNPLLWAIKGLLGGPLTVRLLRESETLITRGEEAQRKQREL